MPAATLKRKPRIVEAAPTIPDERLPLFDAIEAKRRADVAVAKQEQAIGRASEMVDKVEQDIETLRARIAAADQTDVKRAASLVKAERPITSSWVGDNARSAVTNAQEKLALTRRALEQLQKDLAVMQDDAAAAQNAVLVEIKKLMLPLVEKVIDDLRAAKRRSIIATTVLNELLADSGRRLQFNETMRSMRADDAREAPLKEFKAGFEHVQFGQTDADFVAARAAVEAIKAALLALQTDPLAKLPEV